MFRLRTTTSLSVLALAIGVAGTQWLSGLNTGWAGPSERVAGYVPAAHRVSVPVREQLRALPHRALGQSRVVAMAHREVLPAIVTAVQAETIPSPPELVPVAMPETPVSWSRMEGHLHGRVLLRLTIDDGGRVTDASLAESSGDSILDAHALATVRGWRFAVPADHPDGFSGELPMRYNSSNSFASSSP